MASGLTEAANLVVEDGTGLDDANSYVSIADADAYAFDRQVGPFIAWLQANESNKVAALITATQYVDLRWQYVGTITVEDTGSGDPQALKWPRGPAIDADGIDVSDEVAGQIIDATIEYAARAIDPSTCEARELLFDQENLDNANRFIKLKREKLGPLEEETRYSESRATSKLRDYGQADKIIRESGLLASSGERTVRA
ncbi:MAG: DnaT-like ssDNA-binding protein [Gemmatimonadota bacterium]